MFCRETPVCEGMQPSSRDVCSAKKRSHDRHVTVTATDLAPLGTASGARGKAAAMRGAGGVTGDRTIGDQGDLSRISFTGAESAVTIITIRLGDGLRGAKAGPSGAMRVEIVKYEMRACVLAGQR